MGHVGRTRQVSFLETKTGEHIRAELIRKKFGQCGHTRGGRARKQSQQLVYALTDAACQTDARLVARARIVECFSSGLFPVSGMGYVKRNSTKRSTDA